MVLRLKYKEIRNKLKIKRLSSSMVVHTCNSSHFRGRDRRSYSLRPPWAKLARILSQN
jgi:hypothetical protein